MNDPIQTYEEWAKRPSWHGGYDDYVRHMRGMHAYYEQERENRLVKKLADELESRRKARRGK